MKRALNHYIALIVALGLMSNVYASCIGAGPQAPRDIDSLDGINQTYFEVAPDIEDMYHCNTHYHWNAEHKATDYSTFVDRGDDHSGWACNAPLYPQDEDRGDIVLPGDTVEVHWVYTTCNITEYNEQFGNRDGLANCVTDTCANPQLRVEAQVFVVEENGAVTSLESPVDHNDPTATYIGSTTGPSYSNAHCSPYQVTWNVKSTCGSLDSETLEDWSDLNHEHAHGVRQLVKDTSLLSLIQYFDQASD